MQQIKGGLLQGRRLRRQLAPLCLSNAGRSRQATWLDVQGQHSYGLLVQLSRLGWQNTLRLG
ncbi:MAG: hypothetical protein V3U27_07920 [Candidatus Tectomicrobia bacterium]